METEARRIGGNMSALKQLAAALFVVIYTALPGNALETSLTPREMFINQMAELAETIAEDESQNFRRAHYKSDIGVCKNYVAYLFTKFKDGYEMNEYPDVRIRMPDNNPNCEPYKYGVEWKDTPAKNGNAFDIAGSFRYDDKLTDEENRQAAAEMLWCVKRGDFFQLVGDYGGGKGPHSLMFIEDYIEDYESGVLRWADSNMTGRTINGERWGYVQYDTQRTVEWMVDVICLPKHGATLYRLRDDLILKR